MLINDASRAFPGEQHDGVRAGRGAELRRQRRPRRAFFVLGEAEGDLAGIAVGGAIDLAGPPAADVAHHELQRAPDRQVRAVALTEDVHAGIHADRPADRAVDDEHGPHRHRRGEHPVNVELFGAGGLDRGEHDRQVFRLASGHHGVDRHLLDRALDEVGGDHGDDCVGLARRALEHMHHALLGRWHDGKSIAPAAFEHRFVLVLERRELHPPGPQLRGAAGDEVPERRVVQGEDEPAEQPEVFANRRRDEREQNADGAAGAVPGHEIGGVRDTHGQVADHVEASHRLHAPVIRRVRLRRGFRPGQWCARA